MAARLATVCAGALIAAAGALPAGATEPALSPDAAPSGALSLTHASVFLLAAQTVTPLSVPAAVSVLAPSPFVAALIHDEDHVIADLPGTAARSHAPESWFVDSVVNGMRSGLYKTSDRDFTRESVLEGPRFFARESRLYFTPRRDSEEIAEDIREADRRLFFRTGLEALRGTLVQTDVYYHLFRHVDDVDFHLLFSNSTAPDPGSDRSVTVPREETRRTFDDDPDVLTRLDVKFKPSRAFDDPNKIVQIEGWVFDLVEFSVYPANAEAELRLPLYSYRALSIDLVTELEGPNREGVVYIAVQSRF